MSGLASVLAGKQPTGVYQWDASFEPAELRSSVEVAGWRLAYLDGAYAQTKRDVLGALGEILAFPDYYGANFDALDECLDDLSQPTVFLWDAWGILASADERSFATLRRVLTRRAQVDRDDEPGFLVLLRGDGPDMGDLGVPLLD